MRQSIIAIALCFALSGALRAQEQSAVPIEFEFHHELAPTDSGVGVAGSFDGWQNVFPMAQDSANPIIWRRIVPLQEGGVAYKFVTYVSLDGLSGVTNWITDPLNPRFGGPFNDSQLRVTNPIVYYLLPKEGTVVTDNPPRISAKISWRNDDAIDLASIRLQINGEEVPNAADYFDAETRRFVYAPAGPWELGEYTVELSAATRSGASTKTTTTFEVFDPNAILELPYEFVLDSKSPNLQFPDSIETVAVNGRFGGGVFQTLPLQGPDRDGIWRGTVQMKPELPVEYEMVINSGYFNNDPDNPHLSEGQKSVAIRHIEILPEWKKFSHRDGQLFGFPTGFVTLWGIIVPNDSGTGIVKSSIVAKLDGKSVFPILVPSSGGWMTVVNQTNIPEGRHVITFAGRDSSGHASEPASLSIGVYPPNSGFHHIDSFDDDRGGGDYRYPAAIPDGSADITELHIVANAAQDSLLFTIGLDTLSDYSRVDLFILREISPKRTLLGDLNLTVPVWERRGVRIPLAKPGGTAFAAGRDNLIWRDSATAVDSIVLDADALRANTFRFRIAVAPLKQAIGNAGQPWAFAAFASLGQGGKVVGSDAEHGEHAQINAPNVWDVAFMPDRKTQFRLLGNYIAPQQPGPERHAAIASADRGWKAIPLTRFGLPAAAGRAVKLLARGGPTYADSLRLYGEVAPAAPGVSVEIFQNGALAKTVVTDDSGAFAEKFHLVYGDNSFYAVVRDSAGDSRSNEAHYLRRRAEKESRFTIDAAIDVERVTLTMQHEMPGGYKRFLWREDPGNPQPVGIDGAATDQVSFAVPDSLGDYFFTAKSVAGDSHTVRLWLIRDESGMRLPQANEHAPWIDRAVVYEIFVRTFSREGTLKKVTSRLDSLASLGVNCIWFMPLHPTPSTHGYWITDYFEINPDYGTKEDFRELVREAHKRGIRVIMDLVIQHTSFLHPWMQDAMAAGERSPFYDHYLWDAPGQFHYLFTWVNLPSLNFSSATLRRYLLNMIRYWVEEFDIDGYRADVAWAIEQLRADGPAFWQEMRRTVHEIKADALFIAEADFLDVPSILDKKFDAAYDWNFFNKMRNFIGGQITPDQFHNEMLGYTLTDGVPRPPLPFRFLENHDEERFIKQRGPEATRMAATLLLSLPGLPMIYAGQEFGETEFRSLIDRTDPYGLRPFYRKLIRTRRAHPALQQGEYHPIAANDGLFAFARTAGKDLALFLLNLDSQPKIARLHDPVLQTPPKPYWEDVATGYSFSHGDTLQIEIGGREAMLLLPSNKTPTAIVNRGAALPRRFALEQNYPNPFNPQTRIRYSVPAGGKPFTLRVFNVLGQEVKRLFEGTQEAGVHELLWDGRNRNGEVVSSGVYFIVLDAGAFRAVKKIMFLQ